MKRACLLVIFLCLGVSVPFFYGAFLVVVNAKTVNFNQANVVLGIAITCLFGLAGLLIAYASFLQKQSPKEQELIFKPLGQKNLE